MARRVATLVRPANRAVSVTRNYGGDAAGGIAYCTYLAEVGVPWNTGLAGAPTFVECTGNGGEQVCVAYLDAASVCRRRFPTAHHRPRLVLGAEPFSAEQADRRGPGRSIARTLR